MKLYTEEQLMKTWNTAFTEALKLDEEDYMPTFYGEFIKQLTPIELPSDEEIDNYARQSGLVHTFVERGAKWMRDKIQGGNNG